MESLDDMRKNSDTSIWALVFVTIAVGIGSGLAGTFLALLLHYVQHIAFGYSPLHIISDESFLDGVSAAAYPRRISVLVICGLIAGLGWMILQYYGKPLISISQSIKTGKKMPPLTTLWHALLQIITIALGSPLGREVAPREVGAIMAAWLSYRAGLTAEETKVMLACGAGAGLAAVYNVPLGGAIFVMEVLLCNFNWSILLPAFTSSAIAVVISWWGLGNVPIYYVSDLLTINSSLVGWSIITGPVFGFAAFWFIKIATMQRAKVFRGRAVFLACLINFTFIGFLAIYFPVLLGNGKSLAQLEFAEALAIEFSSFLLILHSIIVWTSLRAGACGGLLTPSLANGALLGVVLGGLWNMIWPHSPLESFALIGATAFLAAAQKMPLVAIILIFEFTRVNYIFLVPIMFAVSGAIAAAHLAENGIKK